MDKAHLVLREAAAATQQCPVQHGLAPRWVDAGIPTVRTADPHVGQYAQWGTWGSRLGRRELLSVVHANM